MNSLLSSQFHLVNQFCRSCWDKPLTSAKCSTVKWLKCGFWQEITLKLIWTEQVSVAPSQKLINHLPHVTWRVPNWSRFLQRAQSITDLLWNLSNYDVSSAGGHQHKCLEILTDGLGLCRNMCSLCVCAWLSACMFFYFSHERRLQCRTELGMKRMSVKIVYFKKDYLDILFAWNKIPNVFFGCFF